MAGVQDLSDRLESDMKADNVARAASKTVPAILNAL
jgi:hypothetical protein